MSCWLPYCFWHLCCCWSPYCCLESLLLRVSPAVHPTAVNFLAVSSCVPDVVPLLHVTGFSTVADFPTYSCGPSAVDIDADVVPDVNSVIDLVGLPADAGFNTFASIPAFDAVATVLALLLLLLLAFLLWGRRSCCRLAVACCKRRCCCLHNCCFAYLLLLG
jgi:hypothetical protein